MNRYDILYKIHKRKYYRLHQLVTYIFTTNLKKNIQTNTKKSFFKDGQTNNKIKKTHKLKHGKKKYLQIQD